MWFFKGSANLIDIEGCIVSATLTNTDSYRFFDSCLCPFRCHKDECIGRKMVGLAEATHHTRTTERSSACSRSPHPHLHGCRWIVTAVMVTLITEQLRKQSLEEPYDKALNVNVVSPALWRSLVLGECVSLCLVWSLFQSLPAVGSSPTVSWSACGPAQGRFSCSTGSSLTRSWPACSHGFSFMFPDAGSNTRPSFRPSLPDASGGPDSLWPVSRPGRPVQRPDFSFADQAFQSSPPPPPPPPKRHCRSLSVPEDLSTWRPTASKIWTPVKRDCRSGEASTSSSAASSLPVCGAGSSFASYSLHSSSSPTFFSLALTSDSPLPWSFQWDPCYALTGACSASMATPSSCSSSPAPLLQRRFSLSPVHIQECTAVLRSARPSPAAAPAHGCCGGTEHPALSPSPTSACSTPSSCRRGLHPALPRCHSQPCDMRRPRLKRRHDPDVLPCQRPGLDFSKMTQVRARWAGAQQHFPEMSSWWYNNEIFVMCRLVITGAPWAEAATVASSRPLRRSWALPSPPLNSWDGRASARWAKARRTKTTKGTRPSRRRDRSLFLNGTARNWTWTW